MLSNFNPLIINDGVEVLLNNPAWGLPIYEYDSNLSAETRYIENERVSHACLEYVKNNGGINFFKETNWKKQLKDIFKSNQSYYEKERKFQTSEERSEDIKKDLLESKQEIEKKLNKTVSHLCYPWYRGNDLSVEISKKVGYKSNFWGIINNSTTNRIGDNPYYIKRINENYIYTLPGRNRKSLFEIQRDKIVTLIRK